MSENEEEILKAAVKLSFAEQCQHAHWKVRSRAYEMLSSSLDDDEKDEETTNDKEESHESSTILKKRCIKSYPRRTRTP